MSDFRLALQDIIDIKKGRKSGDQPSICSENKNLKEELSDRVRKSYDMQTKLMNSRSSS